MKKLNKLQTLKSLKIQTRIMIYLGQNPNEVSFGKGVATLLRGVEETGSLNAAAKRIKMAYSKAWRIVKETEAGFGFALIDRDGARGSTLTREGQILLDAYEDTESRSAEYAAQRFAATLEEQLESL